MIKIRGGLLAGVLFCGALGMAAISELRAEDAAPAASYSFGLNANGKMTVLKDGKTDPLFFACLAPHSDQYFGTGFNTVFYELYSAKALGKTEEETWQMWEKDLAEIAEAGAKVIIYIHNSRHVREANYVMDLDDAWKADVQKIVRRFKDQPNLIGWNFSDEPGDFVGYPVEEYRKFLERKYGSIEALNKAWESEYKDFSEVGLDRERNGVGLPLPSMANKSYPLGLSTKAFDSAEFKLWRVNSVHEMFAKVVREIDPKTPLWSGAQNLGWAEVAVPAGWGAFEDAYPTYTGNDWATHHIWTMDILRGQNYRPVLPMLMTETDRPDASSKWILDPRVWEGWGVQGALHGSSGVTVWPWGLLAETNIQNQKATPSERAQVFRNMTERLKKSGIFELKPDNSVAVLFQPYAEGWAGISQVYGLLAQPTGEPVGILEQLKFGTASGSVDYLTNPSLMAADLNSYGVLFAPFSADIPEDIQTKLKEFVTNGGILLSDVGFSCKNGGGRLFDMTAGAKELFGIKELKPLKIEGAWKLVNKPALLSEVNLSPTLQLSEKGAVAVTPSTAEAIYAGPGGQGLYINKVGKGFALFYSGLLWDRAPMQNPDIRNIHRALVKNRARITKEDPAQETSLESLAQDYQIFKYDKGFAVGNLTDKEIQAEVSVSGKKYKQTLAPYEAVLVNEDGTKASLGIGFFPADVAHLK